MASDFHFRSCFREWPLRISNSYVSRINSFYEIIKMHTWIICTFLLILLTMLLLQSFRVFIFNLVGWSQYVCTVVMDGESECLYDSKVVLVGILLLMWFKYINILRYMLSTWLMGPIKESFKISVNVGFGRCFTIKMQCVVWGLNLNLCSSNNSLLLWESVEYFASFYLTRLHWQHELHESIGISNKNIICKSRQILNEFCE